MIQIVLVAFGIVVVNAYAFRNKVIFTRGTPTRTITIYASQNTVSNTLSVNVPTLSNVKYRISDLIPPSAIEAVRLRYIALASEELADQCRRMIVENKADFTDLASTLSICDNTKQKGGDTGWLYRDSSDSTPHIAPEILNAAYNMQKGDIKLVSCSSRAENQELVVVWNVLQLVDIQSTIAPTLKKRKSENFKRLQGVKDDTALKYSIETMGCQMNSADSERIQGQLQDLGYTQTHNPSDASIVIFNTCSIRDHAEHKVYSHVGKKV